VGIFVGKLTYEGDVATAVQGAVGWNELYFFDAASYAAADISLGTISGARLATLAADCKLVGVLLSDTAVKGDSYPSAITLGPGSYAPSGPMTSYNPDMAIRVRFDAGTLKRSSRWVRCVPKDSVTADGEYAATVAYGIAISAYLGSVKNLAQMATRIHGAVTPPFYSLSAYTDYDAVALESRKIGRPFSQRRGRRAIA
jgi:hypothetical protein